MAEQNGKQAEKEKEKSEPTERVILAGFELDAGRAAKALVEAGFGQVPETVAADKEAREQLAAEVEKHLKADGDGKVLCWVEVGQGENTDKAKAIAQALGGERFLGFYRAPAQRAWKGGVAKRPPREIAPEVEAID